MACVAFPHPFARLQYCPAWINGYRSVMTEAVLDLEFDRLCVLARRRRKVLAVPVGPTSLDVSSWQIVEPSQRAHDPRWTIYLP